jgi:CBS domain containing-hemolysin-like protein
MVPRTSMVAAPADATLRQIIDLAARTAHSRIPVYVETLDNIIGVVYLKSVMAVLAQMLRTGNSAASLDRLTARDAMREALVVPETLEIDRVMAQMRRSRLHTAIVIDEYGGTAGLVTLEDILERVVGELRDEFEPPEPGIHETEEGDLVDGLYLLADFARRYDLDLEQMEIEQDTVGGYVFSRLGRKPQVGDQVQLGPYTLRVERMQGLRVAMVRVLRGAQAMSEV